MEKIDLQLFGGRGGSSGGGGGGQQQSINVNYDDVKRMSRYGDTRIINEPDSFEKLLALEKRSLKLGRHFAAQDEYNRLRKKYEKQYNIYQNNLFNNLSNKNK